jgi:hypothetical protein
LNFDYFFTRRLDFKKIFASAGWLNFYIKKPTKIIFSLTDFEREPLHGVFRRLSLHHGLKKTECKEGKDMGGGNLEFLLKNLVTFLSQMFWKKHVFQTFMIKK